MGTWARIPIPATYLQPPLLHHSSGIGTSSQPYFTYAVETFNSLDPSIEAVCVKEVLTSPILQWTNTADRAGPLSVSSQHAPLWPLGSFRNPGGHHAVLAAVPSVLDTLVHHALTYKAWR
eukprot:Em0001g2347a